MRPPSLPTNAPARHVLLPNSLRFTAHADLAVTITREAQLVDLLKQPQQTPEPVQVLGGGSNVVLLPRLPGLTLLMRIRGIRLSRARGGILVEVGAGENWHGFVRYTLAQGIAGLENLSLIPGLVGAAPIQNIGAYGVEVGSFIEAVRVVDIVSGEANWLTRDQCEFGYRDSLFRRQPGRLIISCVRFRFGRDHSLQTSYPDIEQELSRMGHPQATASLVATAICRIRRRKLPDPRYTPNAGSFFKNPLISNDAFARLTSSAGQIPAWPQPQGVKLSAAALIEYAGFKAKGTTRVGVWPRQPLVIINKGGASAVEVLEFARQICRRVQDLTAVHLEQEPQVLGID